MSTRIDQMINSMTVAEKARQLTQINAQMLKSDSTAAITGVNKKLGVAVSDLWDTGSVLNFMYGGEMSEVQDAYMEKSEKKIPLAFMHDVINITLRY